MNTQKGLIKSISTNHYKPISNYPFTLLSDKPNRNFKATAPTVFTRQCNHPYFSPQIQCEKLIDKFLYAQHLSLPQTLFSRNLSKIIFPHHNDSDKKPMIRLKPSNSLLFSLKKRNSSQLKQPLPDKYDNFNLKQLKSRIFHIENAPHKDNTLINKKMKRARGKYSQLSVYSLSSLINLHQPQQIKETLPHRKVTKGDSAVFSLSDRLYQPSSSSQVIDYVAKTVSGSNHNEFSSYFALSHVFGLESYQIFGVCSGIGQERKINSSLTKEILVDYLTSSALWLISEEISEEMLFDKLQHSNWEIIRKTLIQVDEDLSKRGFNYVNSGATLALLFVIGKKVVSVNIGNDQIVLLKKEKKTEGAEHLGIRVLTEDHSLKSINERIRLKENVTLFNAIETTHALGFESYIGKGLSREPHIHCEAIDVSWQAIVLGTKLVWDNCFNYNIFKVLSSTDEDLTDKMNKVVQFKRRHLQSVRGDDFSFSLIVISF